MSFLLEKRRIGAVTVLVALVGMVSLLFGPDSARAATGPCDDDAIPTDIWVNVGGLVFVGAQPYSSGGVIATPSYTGAWVCLTPPGNAFAIEFLDNDASKTGGVVWVYQCDHPMTTCNKAVDWTGADIDVVTAIDVPGDANGTVGGAVGAGPGSCIYVNSTTPSCSLTGSAVVGVTVAEGDVSVTPSTRTGCVTAAGNPCLATAPAGVGVAVAEGDPSRNTVEGTVASTPVTADLGQCVGFNAPPGC